MQRSALALFMSLAAPAAAGDITLSLPIDCILGDTCHIQQYADHDPGPGARDFRCATLSYDGHKGTDFALPFLRNLADDVDVLAAAPGVIRATRDGMADSLYETGTDTGGKDCGNGVVIRHADGWETQYCHLKQGSVAVTKGDRVNAGDVLGHVGLSGRTQFPHLHLSLRKDGEPVDPFAPTGTGSCGADTYSLWDDPPTYQPGGVIGTGFSAAVPDFQRIKQGRADEAPLPATASGLVFWAYAFGSRANDILRLEIAGPDGFHLEKDLRLERTQAQLFRAAGKRLKQTRWPDGTYHGTATLIRDGEIIDTQSQSMVIR